jgi:hypothetical protein
MAIITAPTSTISVKPGIRPAIGQTTKAISQTMAILAQEFPELIRFGLGTATQVLGMAFDAIQQARFEGQLENIDETASIVGWTPEQVKIAKYKVMLCWGLELPENIDKLYKDKLEEAKA